jgi:hypothetical protein
LETQLKWDSQKQKVKIKEVNIENSRSADIRKKEEERISQRVWVIDKSGNSH